MKFSNLTYAVLSALLVLLSACTTVTGVKQIATAPRLTPIARYPVIVYTGYMELQVQDVDEAVEHAARLAESYGGYFSSSQSWHVDNRKVTTIELAVPTRSFDSLRGALLELGVLLNETVSSLPSDPSPSDPNPYSSISVHFRPGEVLRLPDPPPARSDTGWSPARTFQRAFSVFLTIFGFIADVLIWVVVVAGPFLLVAAVAWLVLRRLRRAR